MEELQREQQLVKTNQEDSTQAKVKQFLYYFNDL